MRAQARIRILRLFPDLAVEILAERELLLRREAVPREERRVSILYNGDGEQRRRMLDHWGDPDYMYDLVSEVEDSGHALSYDLFRCEDWDE